MIEARDSEIKRLSALYESNISIEKLVQNYSVEKLERQNENLIKQLEFVNTENNKLTEQQVNTKNINETFSSVKSDLLHANQQLKHRTLQVERVQAELDQKNAHIQRLTEQYNTSQKPSLSGLYTSEEQRKQLDQKSEEIRVLGEKLKQYQTLEIQFNSER